MPTVLKKSRNRPPVEKKSLLPVAGRVKQSLKFPGDLEAQDKKFIWHPFTQMNDWQKEKMLIIQSGKGSFLQDIQGRRYLDGVSSLWCNVHGHRVNAIDRAVKKGLGVGEGIMEKLIYEAYAVGGAALIIEVLTDNRNKAAQEIKRVGLLENQFEGALFPDMEALCIL